MKTLYLIDASSLFFRAFFGIPPLTSAQGLPTNAIYGFLNQLLKLVRSKNPDHIVLCLDRKEPSFRKDLYSDYKANRTEIPESLEPQMPYIEKVGEVLGIPTVSVAGFEADDIIGTLARKAQEAGLRVCIVSGDKDFAQLINDQVEMYDTMKDFTYGPQQVVEKWGVRPDQFIDYLALVGDSSDHIPGVAGIGPKGAVKLLSEHGTLDQIYERIGEIKGATQEKLLKSKDMAYLSKKLVSIVQDAPSPITIEECRLKKISKENLRKFFEDLNFKSFERDVRGLPHLDEEGAVPSLAGAEFVQPEGKAALMPQRESSNLEMDPPVRKISLESVRLEDLHRRISRGGAYWVAADREHLFMMNERADEVLQITSRPDQVGRVLADLDVQYLGYDLKTLWHLLWPIQLEVKSSQMNFLSESNERSAPPQTLKVGEDLLLLGYVLHAGENLALDAMVERVLKRAVSSLEEQIQAMPDLLKAMKNELKRSPHFQDLQRILVEIEYPLIPILFAMEHRGFQIDRDELRRQSESLQASLSQAEKRIHEMAGESFNVGSPKQLSHILFEKLKLKPGRRTKTGFSTDSDVLESLKSEHPIISEILEYREVSKLKSTYVDAFPDLLDAQDRIHTTFRQALTTTGRLSSVDPNLQNIPIRTERGARVRRAFVAASGLKLLSADYSQIELRVLAHISRDPNMCKAFIEDLDIHAATAAEIFKVPLKEVNSQHRRIAKSVNFGIAYGQGAFGLAENLGISRTEAQEIIQKYFAQFPGVKDYIDSTVNAVRERGYVQTLLGRVRKISEIQSQSPVMRKAGERAAINAPIQGTAADIVKLAMVKIASEVKIPMISQVHDELIFEGKETELQTSAPQIVKIMEVVLPLSVPLKVNWAIGTNWDQAH